MGGATPVSNLSKPQSIEIYTDLELSRLAIPEHLYTTPTLCSLPPQSQVSSTGVYMNCSSPADVGGKYFEICQ